MIGRKDMKQETMAKRVRNKAVAKRMVSPRKKMDLGLSPGPNMGAASAPVAPPMLPAGMKKGGKVDFSKIIQNKKTGKLSEKPLSYVTNDRAKKGMKGGGMMLVIGFGKKKPGK